MDRLRVGFVGRALVSPARRNASAACDLEPRTGGIDAGSDIEFSLTTIDAAAIGALAAYAIAGLPPSPATAS
jgi:hypothetical protein